MLPSISTLSLTPGIKPSKVMLEREALKEYRIRTTIGAYRNKYTSAAAIRMRGCRRYGFIPHTPFEVKL
jgi:hypothetical protein